jgi:hypothetical protein
VDSTGSFWVDFGDFSWFRMDKILTARLVGGFARAHQVILAMMYCLSAIISG